MNIPARISRILMTSLCSLALLLVLLPVLAGSGLSQGPGRGPISAPRDLELEKQSYRNLEVAKFYYVNRKPEKNDKAGWERINKAVDGVIFLLGEVYRRGGDLEAAREQWTKIVKSYPDSEFKAKAQQRLDQAKP